MHTPNHSSGYRQRTELNGQWEFAVDPDGAGRERDWYDVDAAWPERARMVEVPHAWQELDDYRAYTGTAWYRRPVTLDVPSDERVLLQFGAVDYEATVWVNGDRVGSNRGGYLPFAIDVTDALVAGENVVVVECTDPADLREIPHGKQGEPWYQRVSGIWQDVTLTVVPPRRIETIRATPDLDTDCVHIEVGTVVHGDRDRDDDTVATVRVTHDGDAVASAETTLDPNGAGAVTVSIDDPEYWTPDTPVLYDVCIDLEHDGTVVDQVHDYFGMRSVSSSDGRVYLNGEPYPIRGALEQGYYPKTLYRPFDDDWFETEVKTAKELGFNLLRKHIKPAHPDFLECADRLGILVWEEPANPTVHTDRSKRELRDQLAAMIDRDYNRPSVVVWSVYNEEWGIGNPQGLDDETSLWEDETKQQYLAELYEATNEADPTRLVCDNSGWAHVATDVNDYHRYFVSPDRADAWETDLDHMLESPEANYAATETDPRDAPIVVSEFGTWGLCDVSAIEAYYDGRPPWFDYEFLTEGLKRPAGYRERYEETALADAFGEFDALVDAWQRREFRSNKDVIERMRARDGIAGYVVTEFSDIEWEFNGILDYRREEKSFHDAFARVNAPVAVQIDLESRAVWDDETVEAGVVVVNDTSNRIEATLSWSAVGESGQRTVAVDAASTVRIADLVAVDAPSVEEVTTETITVAFDDATTEASVSVGPRTEFGLPDTVDDAIYVEDEPLRDALERRGAPVTDSLDDTVDVAVTTTTDAVLEFARDGGAALLVADRDGSVADEEVFDYRDLPEDESWNLVASLFYTNDDRLEALLGTVPGWELDGMYPFVVAATAEDDDVQLGYVEGWLANPSAVIETRRYGAGTIRVCTLRICDRYGTCPIATALLDELLANALESADGR